MLIKLAALHRNIIVKQIANAIKEGDDKFIVKKYKDIKEYITGKQIEKTASRVVPRTRHNSFHDNNEVLGYGGYMTSVEPKSFYFKGQQSHDIKIKATNPRHFINRLKSPGYPIFANPDDIKTVHRLGIKHELHERRYAQRILKDSGDIEAYGSVARGLTETETGRHFSLGVLGHESNDLLNIKNKKIKDMHQKSRYLTGETEILKNITGKRYGIDKFTEQDLEKLHKASIKSKGNPFKAKSKAAIGTIAGAGLGAYAGKLLSKNDDEETTALKVGGGAIAGAIAGGPIEGFIRTNILRLHKR